MPDNEKMIKILVGLVTIINVLNIFSTALVFAQDTTSVVSDSSVIADTTNNVNVGEVVLLEINIEAEIEKPRVSILPKRMDPEMGEMEFIDRSFENELKQGPEKPFLIEKHVKTPVKLNKKKIDKKQKKNK